MADPLSLEWLLDISTLAHRCRSGSRGSAPFRFASISSSSVRRGRRPSHLGNRVDVRGSLTRCGRQPGELEKLEFWNLCANARSRGFTLERRLEHLSGVLALSERWVRPAA